MVSCFKLLGLHTARDPKAAGRRYGMIHMTRARRTVELGPLERAFIRDLPLPDPLPPGCNWFQWLRMKLDLRKPELHGPDNMLQAIWRSGGREVIAELGATQAKQLSCWQAFGDPRD